MAKKLTITVDAEVYEGLLSVIGRRRISRFLNDLARPHVVGQALATGYAAMAADEARETAAKAWTEGLISDVADEPRRHSAWTPRRYAARSGEGRKAMASQITAASKRGLRRRLGALGMQDLEAVGPGSSRPTGSSRPGLEDCLHGSVDCLRAMALSAPPI